MTEEKKDQAKNRVLKFIFLLIGSTLVGFYMESALFGAMVFFFLWALVVQD